VVLVSAWALVDTFRKDPERWMSVFDFLIAASYPIEGTTMKSIAIIVFTSSTILSALRIRDTRVGHLVLDVTICFILYALFALAIDGSIVGL